MSYGLLCALSWGISTLLAAVAARRIGALRTLVVGETAGLAGYLTLFALGHFSLHGVGSTAWLLVLAGVIAVTGYLAMYRGLLCYGVGGFMIGRYAREFGWLVPVVVARGGAMVLLLGLLATPLRGPVATSLRGPVGTSLRGPVGTSLRGPVGTQRASGVAWALAAGLTDAAGLVFFARGDQVGLVSVTAAVSSAYPVIPLVGGVLLFRERMARPQIGGAILILAGLVLLGLGS